MFQKSFITFEANDIGLSLNGLGKRRQVKAMYKVDLDMSDVVYDHNWACFLSTASSWPVLIARFYYTIKQVTLAKINWCVTPDATILQKDALRGCSPFFCVSLDVIAVRAATRRLHFNPCRCAADMVVSLLLKVSTLHSPVFCDRRICCLTSFYLTGYIGSGWYETLFPPSVVQSTWLYCSWLTWCT